jgi:hypothetical protein
MKKPCEDCRGVGFLLMQNDTHGLRIERCDTCRKYRSDDAAVTAAFKMATTSVVRGWRRIADKDVRHRWDLDCDCHAPPDSDGAGAERSVYVEPWFYAKRGTPICEQCGKDRRYVRTEVRACPGHSPASCR